MKVLRAILITCLGAVALAAVLEEALPHNGDSALLAADDECSAVGGDDTCGLSALQMRGRRLSGSPLYMPRPLVAAEGSEIGYRSGVDVEACSLACASTPGCKSFTYGYSGEDSGRCFLKDKLVSVADPESSIDWNKQRFRTYYAPELAPGYIARTLVANEGKQVGLYAHSTPAVCGQMCDRNPACRCFTYSLGGNDLGTCYLKDRLVSAGDAATTSTWNREHYLTYYKERVPKPIVKPKPIVEAKTSSEYFHGTRCKPGALITSVEGCRAAAEAFGYTPSRPRIVPQAEATLPPGCLFGPAVGKLTAGMWFNPLGLAFFKPELNKVVKSDEGYEMLCKKHPYELAGMGATCDKGKDIASVGECGEAADTLGLGSPKEVPAAQAYTTTQGCFSAASGEYKGVWYNGAAMTFSSSDDKLQRICRTEAPSGAR